MIERWGDSQRDRDALDRWITTEPDDEPEYDEYDEPCPGHESLSGPIGNVVYCDGSCQG